MTVLAWMAEPPATPALVDASGDRVLDFRELADRVSALAERLRRPRKSLVICLCGSDVDTVLAYLASLHAGHAVLLADAERPEFVPALVERFKAAFVVDPHQRIQESEHYPDVHPDLALLLATSGSTGNAKYVRLSHGALNANAEQISSALDLDETARAVQSLPLHYSYGLSVLNSHLHARASVVFSAHSIVTRRFWDDVSEHRCTSFAGVPFSFTILDRIGFPRMELPALRTLTHAGGPMAMEAMVRYATLMADRGGRFYSMYGQTEATARMSVVPWQQAVEKAGKIGLPVSRGDFDIADDGELIYRGPNVMMGYAKSYRDLALGDVTGGTLPTGDLGRRDDDGFYRIVGRKSRIAKIAGYRINLDDIAAMSGSSPMVAVEHNEQVVIVREKEADGTSAEELSRHIGQFVGLPSRFFRVEEVDALPMTGTGKVDLPAVSERVVQNS
ncbi:AMP-binding protein [Streptomyces orinoci]|uniref:AMP-binding protein n=1 Tax=Streptomyces orinoci TaxID=67339 RepID=A0ABV3JYH4_STRON|nr:AMP-binding protein [Streptomyces orinoci]